MSQKYITIDGNNVVTNALDEDSPDLANDAIPITDSDLLRLGIGFDLFKYENGALVSNEALVLSRGRQAKIDALIKNELNKAARASISGQITAIENMNEATLDTAMNAAGLS